MKRTYAVLMLAAALAVVARVAVAEQQPATAAAGAIAGSWTGLWGPYSHEKGVTPQENCKLIECVIQEKDGGIWEAKFEGECGRPYKYTITVEGRRNGECLMFKGSADLGEADGGVYDWIGRASATEFIGFYTSAHHSGTFRMTPKPAAEAVTPAVN